MRYKLWLCVPSLIYLLATAYWHCRGADELSGDETYYMLVTESMVEDRDVDTQNNLANIGIDTPLFSLSQSFVRPYGWFSIHNIGLSALVAVPWWLGGVWGARLMMAVCAGGAAPLIYGTINHVWNSPRNALLLTLGLTLGMPLVYACHQIYPDIVAGLLLLFAAATAMAASREQPSSPWHEAFFALALVFLPWLHIKFIAPALLVLAWYIDSCRRRQCAVLAAAFAASVILLAWYNVYAYERIIGPYFGDALVLEWKSAIVFLGLHFDQAQGMFLQQPLWLLGLIGLGPLWRSAPRSCLWWLLLYASVVVPNAMHPNWYGGSSYLGRFGSTGALLWAVPLAYAARWLFAESRTWPAVVAGLSLLLQTLLASHWLAADGIEVGGLQPASLCACQSVYPTALKLFLPFFQPEAVSWRYASNLAALLLASGALTSGFFLLRHRVVAMRCFVAASVAALLVAVSPGRTPRMEWTSDSLQGDVGIGNGEMRLATEGVAERGLLARSPDLAFDQPGDYQVAVDYQADGTGDFIGCLALRTDKDFKLVSLLPPSGGKTQRQSGLLNVPAPECGKRVSACVWYEGRGSLSVARLAIELRR